MLALGRKAKDTVTGFTGTITAHAEYLNDPVPRYQIENEEKGRWFDEKRLEVLPE